MIKAFAGNIVFVLILIPIFVATNLTLEFFFNAFNASELHFTNLLDLDLTPTINWLNITLVTLVLTINALLINYTFNSHEFYDKNTYLPSFIYVLIACFFPMSVYVNGELIAQTFAILAINQLFMIRQNEDARKWLFNSAFFIGFAYIFNPIYFIYFIVLFIVLLNIRPFQLREYAMGLIGFLIPLLWLFLYHVLGDKEFNLLMIASSSIEHTAYLDFDRLPFWVIILPHFLILPLLASALFFLSKRFGKSSIRFKRLIQNTLALTIGAIFVSILLLLTSESYYYFSIGATVLPLIIPYAYLESKSKNLASVLIYLLIVVHLVKFIF